MAKKNQPHGAAGSVHGTSARLLDQHQFLDGLSNLLVGILELCGCRRLVVENEVSLVRRGAGLQHVDCVVVGQLEADREDLDFVVLDVRAQIAGMGP